MLADPKFLRTICRYLGRKINGNSLNSTQNQGYPLKYRLASYILLTSLNGVYNEPHTETAEYLRVSYRHLLYVLAQFCRQGLIEHGPNGYLVRDPDGLRALEEEMRG